MQETGKSGQQEIQTGRQLALHIEEKQAEVQKAQNNRKDTK